MKDIKGKEILLIVLCIFVGVLIGVLIYLKLNYKETENEIKVDEAGIQKEIEAKVQAITVDNLLTEIYSGNDFNIEDVNKSLVLKSLLMNTEEDGELTNEESLVFNKKVGVCVNSSYINQSKIEKNLNNIYGYNKIKFNYIEDVANTGYVYDDINKRFFELCTNNMSNNFIDSYIYDFKLESNKAYLYVAVAHGIETDVLTNGQATGETKVIIYNDSSKTNIYKEYIYSNTTEEDFELNKDNYKDFELYKYTFIKENNNYYFYSLAKEK